MGKTCVDVEETYDEVLQKLLSYFRGEGKSVKVRRSGRITKLKYGMFSSLKIFYNPYEEKATVCGDANIIDTVFPQSEKTMPVTQASEPLFSGFSRIGLSNTNEIADALVRYRILKKKAKVARRALMYSITIGLIVGVAVGMTMSPMNGLVSGLLITAYLTVFMPLYDFRFKIVDEIYFPLKYWQYKAEAEAIRSQLETTLPLMQEGTLKDLVRKELNSG